MVNRKRLHDGLVRQRELSGLVEPAGRRMGGDCELVDVCDVVGVADLVEHAEPLLRPNEGRVEVTRSECSHALPCPGIGQELRVADAFGQLRRLLGDLRPRIAEPHGAGDQRLRPRDVVCRGGLERAVDPALDELRFREPPPHAASQRRLEGELPVSFSSDVRVRGNVERALHSLEERLAVELQRVDCPDHPPEPRLSLLRRLEGESAVQEREGIIELEPPERELPRALEPEECLVLQASPLPFVFGPREVDVLRPDGLGVVVRQEPSKLVALAEAVEPVGERRVKTRPPRLWQGRVGDLAGEGVLDRVFPLSRHARPAAAADQVALLEDAQVRLRLDELVDRPAPEDAPDHGCSLERRLLGRLEQVDAGGENRVDRVRHGEIGRKLVERPAAVGAAQHALVDQHPEQLLDEERVAFGPRHHELAEL